jgi:hypothetical protein
MTLGMPGPAGLHLALEQAGHQIGAAAVGHVQEIDAGLRGEDRHREVVDRAGARRPVAQLAGLRPGQGDEFRQGLGRHRRMHDQHRRHRDERGDRRKIAQRVVAQVRVEHDVDRHRAGIAQHQHVAVGRRRRHRLGGHHAAGARDVLDHERLAESSGQLLREQPGEHVRIAAGRRGRDQAHRPVRIVIALRDGAGHERARQRQSERQGH